MKRQAQPALSIGSQQALDQYASALKQEDLEAKSIRNYLSDLRQFMAWCECSWYDEQDKQGVRVSLNGTHQQCNSTLAPVRNDKEHLQIRCVAFSGLP